MTHELKSERHVEMLSTAELMEHIKAGKEILNHDDLDIVDSMDIESQIARCQNEISRREGKGR